MKNIIIVGGGSAGWMSAATLIRAFPDKNITVIESPDVSTIGVGESTLGHINGWLNYLNIEDKDFMPHCDASYKLSIKFTDFYKKGAGSFHYPFGRPYYWDNKERNKWYFRKQLLNLPNSDYAECMSPNVLMSNANKISDENDIVPNYNFKTDSAYHFDATKFGLYLRDHYCIPRGVKHIKENIDSIEHDETGVTSLNNNHVADLFIDCTGFKSMLLGETLKEPFDSYSHMLPNNSAWATRIPYIDKEKELNSYTNCTALGNGWVWNIPLWSRIGTGYVYSNKHITDEEALQEFKEHLGRDDLEFKNIKMRVGIHERVFVKNVCAIGLSAGFIEPLESNGLYTVHDFLLKLVKVLKRGDDISQFDRDTFNISAKARFRTFAEFVALHYALSHRDDTPYWKEIKEKQFDKTMNIDNVKFITGFTHLITDRMIQKKYELDEGISCIATGLNYFPTYIQDVLSYECQPKYDLNKTKENILDNVRHLDLQKNRWYDSVKNEKSLYEYLRDNIHNDN